MANLDKVNKKVSVKNFNIDQISNALTDHQNSLVKLALILGTLFLAGVMYNNEQGKEKTIVSNKSQIQEKLEAIAAHELIIKKLSDFKASLPEAIDEFQLISLISDLSKSYHINISSLSPAESKNRGSYDIIKISFRGTSDDFREMVLFLRRIEVSKYPLRIDSWEGHEVGNGKIDLQLQISAVIIHK